MARCRACGIIRIAGRGLEALPTLGCLRVGQIQWRNRLPRRVSRERLVRVCRGRFRLVSDKEPDREGSGAQGPGLPEHYYLDKSDPDVLVLRRQDGTFVAAFSAQGATREGIVEAAKEDYYAALMSGRGSGDEEPDPADSGV
jgi:hypothetical protein